MGKKILAVASAGGHWIQLLRLRPAFEGNEVRYVSTNEGLSETLNEKLYIVMDSNEKEKLKLIRSFFQLFLVFITYRPDVVITTGAAPGLFSILWGRLFNCKTIWLDSIANAEELSKSGKLAKRFANTHLTQWEHISDQKTLYKGKVV